MIELNNCSVQYQTSKQYLHIKLRKTIFAKKNYPVCILYLGTFQRNQLVIGKKSAQLFNKQVICSTLYP